MDAHFKLLQNPRDFPGENLSILLLRLLSAMNWKLADNTLQCIELKTTFLTKFEKNAITFF